MHILDCDTDKKINCITLLLTKTELKQLLGYAQQLLQTEPLSDHYHLSSEDYQKEITICLYDPNKTDTLQPRIKKLLAQDG